MDLLDKGLPVALDAERFVLASILLDGNIYISIAGQLEPADFALESNRRIWAAMRELYDASTPIDRVTLAHQLHENGQLESVGGLTYIVGLDDGIPKVSNVDHYVNLIRDKSTLRKMIYASQNIMNRCLLANEKPEEIMADAGETFLGLRETRSTVTSGLRTAGQIMDAFPGGINAFLDPTKRQKGIPTGFTKLDEMTGGLYPGELTILAARPSVGKTALALNIAQFIAIKYSYGVAVFSLEMSSAALLNRMICALARVDSQRWRAGYVNEGERRRMNTAAMQMQDAPIYIDESSAIGLLELHGKVRDMQREHPVHLVVVDYLQLMALKGKTESRQQEVSALSRGLKALSKDLSVPMLVLSQLSRAPETRTGDHRPQLSDLRESGALEQDADLVAFIFREEMYKRDREDLRGLAELIIAKQRNGPIGKIDLVFIHGLTKFENRAEDIEGALPLGAGDDLQLQ